MDGGMKLSMFARWISGRWLVFFLLLGALPCAAKDKVKYPATDVGKTVEQGVGYLKAKQGKDGAWNGDGYETGVTALAVYALLKADCPLGDRVVAMGIESLLHASIRSNASHAATYEVSLAALALAAGIEKAAEKKENPAPAVDLVACCLKLQEAVDWLVGAMHECRSENVLKRTRRSAKQREGKIKLVELAGGGYDLGAFHEADGGAWGYRLADSTYVDNSNTQFALLGLRAAQNIHDYHSGAGIAIPREVWEKALARLVAVQAGPGEWDYGTSALGTRGFQSTMTAAGIGGIVICLSSLVEKPDLNTISRTPEILKALGRLERYVYPPANTFRFDSTGVNPSDRNGYMLYSLERACMLGGFKKLGEHDWYADGAADLLRAQQSDGSWSSGAWYSGHDSRSRSPKFRDNTIETCFALLFLTRGCVYTPARSPYNPSATP
jgi:hypothetical protein